MPSIITQGWRSVAINGEICNGVIKFLGRSLQWDFFSLSLFQFFFFSKILLPEVDAYWPRWVKLEGTLSSIMMILTGLLVVFFRGVRPKLGSRNLAFCNGSLIAWMNSLGLSSNVRQIAASI